MRVREGRRKGEGKEKEEDKRKISRDLIATEKDLIVRWRDLNRKRKKGGRVAAKHRG